MVPSIETMTATDEQRRRARRTAIVLSLVAIAIYVGFIALTVHRSHG
jgi:uncharacterized membrane protein (DUF485 family)